MRHKHHIIPKHMGGSDDPSNLYECSTEEHANLHLALYLEHGHWEDWVASQAISGIMKNEDVIREVLVQNGRKKRGPETKKKMSESALKSWETRDRTPGFVPTTKGYKHTDEAREKIRQAQLNRWAKLRQNASK